MKKSLLVLLAILGVCCVTGCSQADTTDTTETQELATVLTWQEQYDLGMKYLSEGNYQEAIIAFTAAIELAPKAVDGYLGLADTYVAMGDTDMALSVLEQGLSLLPDDATLQAKLAEINASTLNEWGATIFDQRINYREFSELEAWRQVIIETMAPVVIAQDIDALFALMQEAEGGTWTGGQQVYTTWNGYKVDFVPYLSDEIDEHGCISSEIYLTLRPEFGMGYHIGIYRSDLADVSLAGDSWMEYFIRATVFACPCENWQWNGDVEETNTAHYLWRSADGASNESWETEVLAGAVSNCLFDGTWSYSYEEVNSRFDDRADAYTYVFDNGICVESDNDRIETNDETIIYAIGGHSTSYGLSRITDMGDQWKLDELWW